MIKQASGRRFLTRTLVAAVVTLSACVGSANANRFSVKQVTLSNNAKQIEVQSNLGAAVDDEVQVARAHNFSGGVFDPNIVKLYLGNRNVGRITPEQWTATPPCVKKFGNTQDAYIQCPISAGEMVDIKTGGGNDLVENISAVPTVIWGGNGGDRLDGGLGMDIIFGEGGPDKISDAGGNDQRIFGVQNAMDGGEGNDEIESQFTAYTEASLDIHGVTADDLMVGGPGSDTINGMRGRDQIEARDGTKDKVECSEDPDRFRADTFDVVSPFCEQQLP